MNPAKILVLDFDSEGDLSNALRNILASSIHLGLQFRHESVEVDDLSCCKWDFAKIISAFHPDIIALVLSPNLLRQTAVLFHSLRKKLLETRILVVIKAERPEEIFELLKLGADDFITPPLREIDILPRIWRFSGKSRHEDTLTSQLKRKIGLQQLVGQNPVFLMAIEKIPLVAKCDASILISGETGTGKELCARAIHYLSPRADKPIIPVNCGAIPLDLLENELFGHEKGAFTGATTSQLGLIQEAEGGTLFLDEIDCLPLLAQVKLLRFLQDKEYRPLGSTKMRRADVRIIAAANTNLEEAARNGRLRQDLYYRLNVIPLTLPPLRERGEDIPLLARHFLAKYAAEFGKSSIDFSSDAMQVLLLYEWPGNVRELEHVVERAVVLSTDLVIPASDVVLPPLKTTALQESFQEVKAKAIVQFERSYIQGLLQAYQGNITRAAQAAQKNRRAFWQLIRKYEIDVRRFKATAL